MQAVILAGGRGLRLKNVTGDLPKPLVPLCGKPLMFHQIELLKKGGFTDVVILLYYKPDEIMDKVGDGSKFGLHVSYSVEKEPLGTAGSVINALNMLNSTFLVLYGDLVVDADLAGFYRYHKQSGADCTLVVHENDHPYDSDVVELNDVGEVKRIYRHARKLPRRRYVNMVNAGVYVIEKESLKSFKAENRDFGTDLFSEMLVNGAKIRGLKTSDYIKDLGTTERYEKICKEWESLK